MKHFSPEELSAFDRQHLWHPYSSVNSTSPIYPVSDAQGCYIQLADGRRLLDGMASWWSAIHGYKNSQLNAALIEQAEGFAHVMFGGLTHEPAVSLAKRLVDITPEGLNRVFLADSGSVSVEVAMKMALQFCLSQGQTQKTQFLSLRNGYHGDTLGAMSVCDPVTGMHHLFKDILPKQIFLDAPTSRFDEPCSQVDREHLVQTFQQHHSQLAAVILEPIAQGAGGMRFYSAEYLHLVRELCDQYKVLLIADEIATGFGRTGKLFACEHADISPDILCLGKALTGGYMTLAATLCSDRVAFGICEGEAGVFMHGPTFMGNPLACAVANASIDLLFQNNWQSQVANIESKLYGGLAKCRELKGVTDVRVLGAIGVVELEEPVLMEKIVPCFVEAGVWIRPFGKLVYTMPPYVISDSELDNLCEGIYKVLRAYLA